MRSRAEIRVELRRGVSEVTRLAVQAPLLARRTQTSAAPAQVHLVTGAGGPCAGDDLELLVVVEPGASLDLCSVGATVALPGRAGAPTSHLRTRIEVREGATLTFLPEPIVAAKGCDHRMDTVVAMHPSARLVLREELVRGRSGEHPGGDLVARLRVERGGVPLLDQELTLGANPLLPRAIGTLVSVVPAPAHWDATWQRVLGGDGAVTALAAPGAYVAAALAPDTVALRRTLDQALRTQLVAALD